VNPKREARNTLLMMAIIASLFIVSIPFLTRHTDNIFREYPSFNSTDQINSRVTDFDRFKGTTLIVDSNGNKRSIKAIHNKDSKMLYEYLDINDSIAREPNTTVLKLYKSDGTIIDFDIIFVKE